MIPECSKGLFFHCHFVFVNTAGEVLLLTRTGLSNCKWNWRRLSRISCHAQFDAGGSIPTPWDRSRRSLGFALGPCSFFTTWGFFMRAWDIRCTPDSAHRTEVCPSICTFVKRKLYCGESSPEKVVLRSSHLEWFNFKCELFSIFIVDCSFGDSCVCFSCFPDVTCCRDYRSSYCILLVPLLVCIVSEFLWRMKCPSFLGLENRCACELSVLLRKVQISRKSGRRRETTKMFHVSRRHWSFVTMIDFRAKFEAFVCFGSVRFGIQSCSTPDQCVHRRKFTLLCLVWA